MDIDKSLDDVITDRKTAAKPARTNAPRGGAGGFRGGPRGGLAAGGAKPYMRPAPPPRSSNQAWSHDMYGVSDSVARARSAAVPHGQTEASPRLNISNIHYEVTEAELKSIFERAGKIVFGPKLRYDRSGRSMGTATVEYQLPKSARDAINMFDGNLAKGQALQIKYDDLPLRRPHPAAAASSASGGSTSLLNRIQGGKTLASGSPAGVDKRAPVPAGPGAGRGQGAPVLRGGRAVPPRGAPRGRGAAAGGRPPKKTPASAADLDKELDAYHGTPASATEAPAAAAAAPEGDVEMS